VELARTEHIDLTFVGPEVPLSKGIVDIFGRHGLRIVGPTAEQARLESSKVFAKNFFRANNIPTANFWECSTPEEAYSVLDGAIRFPIVIKADGLAAGKGVVIAEDRLLAKGAVKAFMESKSLGNAGARVVIEEFLTGKEVSFHVFADGTSFLPMVASQDHKRRFDGDLGPNTGGMGAYSTDSILSPSQQEDVVNRIIRPTLDRAGSYSGILYAGLMVTPEGPKLLEYNARFGDPETQVILPRLKTGLLEILIDIAEHRLGSHGLEWLPDATATVVLVSRGYPGQMEVGKEIAGLDRARRVDGVKVYHAGTRWEDGRIYTAGGRVLNVTGSGQTLSEALDRAYSAAEMIEFDGREYRKDIGQKGLLEKR
jgi:phosphoribosylamine--glycine ligase